MGAGVFYEHALGIQEDRSCMAWELLRVRGLTEEAFSRDALEGKVEAVSGACAPKQTTSGKAPLARRGYYVGHGGAKSTEVERTGQHSSFSAGFFFKIPRCCRL